MSNVTAIRAGAVAADIEDDRFLSPEDVAEMVPGLSVRTLRELRAAGKGPRYAKPTEKTVVYVESDVRSWVMSTLQTTREQS